jgi:hypothetical protein
MSYRLRILPQNKAIRVREDEILADKIQKAGIDLNAYCNKRGAARKLFCKGRMHYFSLASHPLFQKYFIEALEFRMY